MVAAADCVCVPYVVVVVVVVVLMPLLKAYSGVFIE